MTQEELKQKYCCRCVNSDCNFDCIAKQEYPFDVFICDNGEMFEEETIQEEMLQEQWQEEQEKEFLYDEMRIQNYGFDYGDVKY